MYRAVFCLCFVLLAREALGVALLKDDSQSDRDVYTTSSTVHECKDENVNVEVNEEPSNPTIW